MIPIQSFLARIAACKNKGGIMRMLKASEVDFEQKELSEKINIFMQKMQKQRKVENMHPEMQNALKKQYKPLKWHYLMAKYLTTVIKGSEP